MFHVIYIALQIGNELRSLCVQFSPRNCRLNNFAERQILAVSHQSLALSSVNKSNP
jgi:hypothetical protein